MADAADPSPWPVPWESVEGVRNGPLAWAEYGAVRALLALGSRLPAGGREALAAGFARLARAVDRRHSDAARRFVAQALGGALDGARREALVLAAWRHLALLTLEDARFNEIVVGPRLAEHFEVEMCDGVRELLACGGGGLAIVPHVGYWEGLPAIGAALGFRPAYVVSRPPRNRPLSRFAQATRERRGYRLIHRRGAIESLTRIVAAGGYVGLMLDQRARGKTLVAPFFGRPALCERSVPVLVRRLKKPLFFAACYRTERPFHYRAVFPRVLWPDEIAHAPPEAIAAEINREIERMILARPEQYFWLHDRFRGAPETGAAAAPGAPA
jgi:KDO2-lipid IV(A) lauroyltransferase